MREISVKNWIKRFFIDLVVSTVLERLSGGRSLARTGLGFEISVYRELTGKSASFGLNLVILNDFCAVYRRVFSSLSANSLFFE